MDILFTLYCTLAVLAYVYFSYLVVTSIDDWRQSDPVETPPLIVALLCALLAAMIWPLAVALALPAQFYYRKK